MKHRFDKMTKGFGMCTAQREAMKGFRIGLAIVLLLMIFATFNDILHLASL